MELTFFILSFSFPGRIGPNVIIGPGCVVGDGVRLSKTVLLEKSTVKDHSWLNSTIVGWVPRFLKK